MQMWGQVQFYLKMHQKLFGAQPLGNCNAPTDPLSGFKAQGPMEGAG